MVEVNGVSSPKEDERPERQRTRLDVTLVQKHFIQQIWSQVGPLLAKATDVSEGRYDIIDVYERLLRDPNWHLWAVYEPDLTVVAAITSTFTQYPRMKVLHGQFLGGRRLDEWQDMFCEMFDRWGRDNECQAIEFSGRPGWMKPLRRNGYRPVFVVYQRDL